MHLSNGNSWDPGVVYQCRECGVGNLCDVCHRHEQPRGECDQCPPVPEKLADPEG